MRKVVECQGLRRGERIFFMSAAGNGRNEWRGSGQLIRTTAVTVTPSPSMAKERLCNRYE
jgi:hypothetical protein